MGDFHSTVGERLEAYILKKLGRYVTGYSYTAERNRGYYGWQFFGESPARSVVDSLEKRLPKYLARLVREFGEGECVLDAQVEHPDVWASFGDGLISPKVRASHKEYWDGLQEDAHREYDL